MSESQFETVIAALQVLNVKVDSFDTKFDRVEARLDLFDTRFDRVEARLDLFDARFDKVEARLDLFDTKFDRAEAQLDNINKELKRIANWTPYHANQDVIARLEVIKRG